MEPASVYKIKFDKSIWIDLWINLMFSDSWKPSMFSCYSSICTNYRILECSALYFFSLRALKPVFFLGLCWDPRVQLRVSQESRRSRYRRHEVRSSQFIQKYDTKGQQKGRSHQESGSIATVLYPPLHGEAFNVAFWRSLQRSAVRWTGSFFSSGSACTDDQTFLSKINNWDLIHANHQLIHQLLIHQLSLWWHAENHQLMHQFLEEVEGPPSLVALSDLRAISVAPPPALMKVDTERPKV